MEEIKKVKYIENDENWLKGYGSLLSRLVGIADDLMFFNHFINIEKGKLRIIDYGCACGYFLATLKFINPELDLYGVDIAEEAANIAEKYIGKGKIFWQSCGDAIPLEDESADLIYSISLIEHVPDDAEIIKWFKECRRLLKKDGYFILRTPNCILPMKIKWKIQGRSYIGKSKMHSNPFTAGRLEKMVEPYFRIKEKIYNWGPSIISRFLSKMHFSGQITLVLKKY
jgi:SAM-dependent methyltransferase